MKKLPVLVTLSLAVGLAYYVYYPLPEEIQEQGKVMMMMAGFNTLFHLASLKSWLGFGHQMACLKDLLDARGPKSSGGVWPGVKVSDITFAGIPVRVYEPPAGGEGHPRRGLMYLHGGGWAFGSAKGGMYDNLNRMLSDKLNAVVVSVDYRLYPEVRFPVPYLDCLAAAKHFLSNQVLNKYAIDPERVGITGDSAGGNLAAAVAQELSRDDTVINKFSIQALVYPALQALDFNTPSYLQNAEMPILTKSLMVRFWLQYLGIDLSMESEAMAKNLHHPSTTPEQRARVDWTVLLPPKHKKNYKPLAVDKGSDVTRVPGLLDVRAAPLLAGPEILARCPRTYVVTCEYDVLRDDGMMYARRLQDAGVTVTHDYYQDSFHGSLGFTSWPLDLEVGKRMVKAYVTWLQNNL